MFLALCTPRYALRATRKIGCPKVLTRRQVPPAVSKDTRGALFGKAEFVASRCSAGIRTRTGTISSLKSLSFTAQKFDRTDAHAKIGVDARDNDCQSRAKDFRRAARGLGRLG